MVINDLIPFAPAAVAAAEEGLYEILDLNTGINTEQRVKLLHAAVPVLILAAGTLMHNNPIIAAAGVSALCQLGENFASDIAERRFQRAERVRANLDTLRS
jgi:hypothetical protein